MEKIVEVNGWLMMLGFGGVGGVLSWGIKKILHAFKDDRIKLNQKIANLDGRIDSLEASNVALLGDKIYHLSQSYLDRGWVSVEELKNLERLYKSYKASGGNSTAEVLYLRVQQLPNKPI